MATGPKSRSPSASLRAGFRLRPRPRQRRARRQTVAASAQDDTIYETSSKEDGDPELALISRERRICFCCEELPTHAVRCRVRQPVPGITDAPHFSLLTL